MKTEVEFDEDEGEFLWWEVPDPEFDEDEGAFIIAAWENQI